jgi:hypothetical protein
MAGISVCLPEYTGFVARREEQEEKARRKRTRR